MLNYVRRKSKQRLGFTLVETMIVITIIAVLALVARTSVMTIRKNMDYTEANNNAKTIYMASQANLTQMRSMGELPLLMDAAQYDSPLTEALGAKYFFSYHIPGDSANTSTSYDLIVPASVDATIRNQQVLLVYHPSAGIVHSVFYYEGKGDLPTLYAALDWENEENFADDLKENCIGYYTVGDVDALVDIEFDVRQTAASISFENDREAVITVAVPIVDKSGSNIFTTPDYGHYISGLEVSLIITGQNGGQVTKVFKSGDQGVVFERDNFSNSVLVKIPVDSLTSSFSGFSMEMVNDQLQSTIAPGDNISVTADVTYYPQSTDPIVMIDSATIAGINPMFYALTDNPEYAEDNTKKPYILSVANGRHLQNLNHLDATFAANIESIVFTKENEESTDHVLTWYGDVPFNPINHSNLPAIVGNGVQIKNLVINPDAEGDIGLFARLTNATIKGITLDDPSIATTGTTSTGALIGTADNVTITDCHVTSTSNTISGTANVGGLVGVATNNTQIEKCTSKATVIGSGTAASNVGGLVGSVKDASIISCVVENANIKSSSGSGTDTSKNALGGLVGAVNNTTYDVNKPIRDCDVKDTVNVISVTGSLSDLGGMVGNATNAYITESNSSAYVTGQATSNNTIPNNNLGGFVGRSKDSRYAVIDVILNYKPQYAEDAGGFAGIMSGDSVDNLDITFPKKDSSSQRVVTNFGGIASRCSNGADLNNVELISEITFNVAKKNVAGGFYSFGNGCTIENSTINIKKIEKTADVTAAGFAVENSGTIKKCIANVEMDGGAAFVHKNNGTVKNCYAWTWGAESKLDLGNCQNSYFVDGTNKVVLYNNTAVVTSIKDTDALSGTEAVIALNANNGTTWTKGNGGYPYPMLNGIGHIGDFIQPVISNQPYALRYVETYSDGTTGDLIVHYTASGAATIKDDNLKSDNPTITGTAYYLCHRNGSLGHKVLYASGTAQLTAELANFQLDAANERYTIYELNRNTNYQDSLKLNTYYPLFDANSYRIRTAEQFKNIAQNPSNTFRLANNITVGTADTVNKTFTGKLHGAGLTITANAPLFAEIGEKAVIRDCKITTSLANPFGTFKGAQQIANATHWAASDNVPTYVDGFDSKFTAVAGTAMTVPASLTDCTVNGKNVIRHFYNVATDTIKEETFPYNVTLTSVEATAELLSELAADSNKVPGYFVKVSDTKYERLVSVTYNESESKYVLTTGSGTYDVTTLYTVNGTISKQISGPCYITINGQYLAADATLVDAPTEACVWTGSGNGTYTNSEKTITAFVAEDAFELPAQVAGQATVQFTIQTILRSYESAYLNAGIEIANS